ncbi:MAG: DUF4367 domain-containing protein, partial [Firmicutes bacterium]|nr:DUF4367 domain-containing protein [Bacillota bacterium]
KEEERKEKFAQFRKTALKVAAVMIAFLAVSFFTVMNVEALKVRITNYFMVKNEKSTTIRVNNEQLSTIMPTYLPEGYENVHLKVLEDFYYAIYENQNGDKMILQLIKEKSAVGIDTEKTSVGTVKVKGNDAEFYYKEEVSFLVFKYNDMLFSLHGKVPKKELIKVAESMEYTK